MKRVALVPIVVVAVVLTACGSSKDPVAAPTEAPTTLAPATSTTPPPAASPAPDTTPPTTAALPIVVQPVPPIVIQQPQPPVIVQQPPVIVQQQPPVVVAAPQPQVVYDPTLIPPGTIEDGVHYGYLTSFQGMYQLTFDRVDVAADGTWKNTNSKLRTLPTNPAAWTFSYPYAGMPIQIDVQGQRVTGVYAL